VHGDGETEGTADSGAGVLPHEVNPAKVSAAIVAAVRRPMFTGQI
jgi:hypothetical protein